MVRLVVIEQNPRRVSFDVLILIVSDRPKERYDAQSTKDQRHRNEDHKYIHARTLSAFRITRIEELDIANAAIRGLANPMTASGTAIAL